MSEFYPDPVFLERMREYTEESVYLVGYGKYLERNHYQSFKSVRPPLLGWIIEKNLDGFTSVWQRDCYLIVLDVEYFNPFDYSEVFCEEEKVFGEMEDFCAAVEEVLDSYGIKYLKLMTGQGYHYASKIDEKSDAFDLMAEHGVCTRTTRDKNPDVPRAHNLVHDSAGKLQEFLYEKVFSIYEGEMRPKDICIDGSMMVLDLDLWADPLFMRDVRIAFSSHQKHIMKKYIDRMGSDWCANNVPIGYSISCNGVDLPRRLEIRRNRDEVIGLAGEREVNIPRSNSGWMGMFREYLDSPLGKYHERFDSHDLRDFVAVGQEYVPESCRHVLDDSTKARWTEIKKICDRAFVENKHPMEVVRLFYDLFTAHPQWKIHWVEYDPEMRAKYWVRVFYAMNELLKGYKPLLD